MWEEADRKDTRARAIAQLEKLLRRHQSPGLLSEVEAAIRARFNILWLADRRPYRGALYKG